MLHFVVHTTEALSQGVKILKGEYLLKAINVHKMDQVSELSTCPVCYDTYGLYVLKLCMHYMKYVK